MTVVWSTRERTDSSIIEYGFHKKQLNLTSSGHQKILVNGQRTQFIHIVFLNKLERLTNYCKSLDHLQQIISILNLKQPDYRVGCDWEWSRSYSFRTFPRYSDVTWSPKVAIFGDLGLANGLSRPSLLKASKKQLYDAYIHLG